MEGIHQLSATVFERNHQRFQSSCPSPALIGCGWSAVKNLWALNSDLHWDSTKGCWDYWQTELLWTAFGWIQVPMREIKDLNLKNVSLSLKLAPISTCVSVTHFPRNMYLNQYFMSVLKPVIYQCLPADWLKLFTLVTGDLYGWLIPKRQREPGLAH